jgi:hypothetical protein
MTDSPDEDARAYSDRAEDWRAAWLSIDERLREGWELPWLDESWRDGNPILSAWSPIKRRGVRVIEHSEPDPDPATFWLDSFGDDESDRVAELVFACGRDQSSLEEFVRVATEWIRDGRVRVEFEVPRRLLAA